MNDVTALPAHSPLGPSSAERWLNCPGSVAATRGMKDTTSIYAAEGTAAHTLSEWCRRENKPARHYRGKVIKEDGFDFNVDQQMIDGVQEFVDYCNDVDGDAYYEVRVRYDEWVPEGFGTSDDVRIRDGFCCVTDLKYGKGIQVLAANNTQLMLYALGTYAEFRHLYEFDVFELRVAQPRLNHFDTWTISLKDLLHWAETVIRPGALMTKNVNASFAAGDHCTFCKIKFTCEARTKWALRQIAGSASDFDDLDELILCAEAPAPAALLSHEEVAKSLAVMDAVASWAKDLKAHAMRELQQGHPIGDWKLVAGRSRRVYAVPEDFVAAALEAEKLTDEQIWKRKLVTPPQLEKVIGKKHILMADPERGGIVRKGPGKPKLAPASDSRPALAIDALKEFDDLGNEEDEDED